MSLTYAHRGVRDFQSLLDALDLIINSIDREKFNKSGGTINGNVTITGTLTVSGSTINLGNGRIVLSGSTFFLQEYDGAVWNTLGTIP